jgi:hypothetical protein
VGEQSGPRTDIEDLLTLPERQSCAYRTALLDDVGCHIHGFDPPRSLVVELERGAHPEILSTSPGALNINRRVTREVELPAKRYGPEVVTGCSALIMTV